MMNKMRQHMPLILWILVIAFIGTIVFSWGMGGFKEKQKPGIVGIIEGREISYDYMEQLVDQQYQSYYANSDSEPPESARRDIRNQVWEQLLRETIVHKEAERLHITVSDQEVIHQIRNYPPQFFIELEAFQTDGIFDIEKYRQFLQNPRNVNQVIMLEQSYRQTLFERKLYLLVANTVNVTEAEMRRRFEERNVQGRARFIQFPADEIEVDSSIIGDDEITDYYYTHLDEYFVPEMRRVLFIEFENKTTPEDSAAVLDLGYELYDRIKRGDDLAELARVYSDHHTAPDGGELGYVPRKRLEADADKAVWSAKVGDLIEPIVNRYGFFIYRVDDSMLVEGEEKRKLSLIQLKFMPSPETKDNVLNMAQNFIEEAREFGFIVAATAYGIEVDTSGYFEQLQFVPGIGKLKSVVDYAFAYPKRTVSDLYPLRKGWLVLQVDDIQNEHNKPLEEVREEIFDELYRQRQFEAAGEQYLAFYEKISDPAKWEDSAEAEGLEVQETEKLFTFNGYVPETGRDLAFTSTLLNSEVGELVGPVKGKKGYYLLSYIEKTSIDIAIYNEGLEENRRMMLQNKQEIIYKAWYEDLLANADIEDYRYLYYRDY